jgi:hypothetical protein
VKCWLNVKHLTAQQVSGSAAVVGFSVSVIRVVLSVIFYDRMGEVSDVEDRSLDALGTFKLCTINSDVLD